MSEDSAKYQRGEGFTIETTDFSRLEEYCGFKIQCSPNKPPLDMRTFGNRAAAIAQVFADEWDRSVFGIADMDTSQIKVGRVYDYLNIDEYEQVLIVAALEMTNMDGALGSLVLYVFVDADDVEEA